jgi:hypothetical protein
VSEAESLSPPLFVMNTLLHFFVIAALPITVTFSDESARVEIQLDTSEADAVLSILDKNAAAQEVTDADWRALFGSRPYLRLKEREAGLKRNFTDSEFREFVLTGEAAGHGVELRRVLEEWRRADFQGIASRMLAYLPSRATVRATVYPVIKPQHNSFVWELDKDPAVFFYLDPAISAAQFENNAAHELHHVGLHSISREYETLIARLPEQVRLAADLMGCFGEGFAMLAAAGSPDIHPHVASSPEDRRRWDRDMAGFDSDLRTVDGFFRDVASGKLSSGEANDRAMAFFGVQGPWYTVGYRMAASVERQYGRQALLECMEDPRKLLATWNQIAAGNAKWSDDLLQAVEATPVSAP